MDKSTTNIIKFVCCIFIFFHHFFILDDVVCTWGRIACSVFFFLSAYGIGKSQQINGYGFATFIKKRISRIFIPYVIVNILSFVLVPFLLSDIGGGIPIFHLVDHSITFKDCRFITEYISYIIGLRKIDGVTWFLDVLVISYVFIWLTGKIRKQNVRIAAILAVPISMLIFDRLLHTNICNWPTDVIGVIAGLLFVEYESVITNYTIKHYSTVFTTNLTLLGVFVLLYVWGHSNGTVPWRYMQMDMLIFSLFSVGTAMCIALKYRCKYANCCTLLGGISFFIYLIHIKIINVLAAYNVSPLVIWSFVGSIIVSYLLYIVDNYIQSRLWKEK